MYALWRTGWWQNWNIKFKKMKNEKRKKIIFLNIFVFAKFSPNLSVCLSMSPSLPFYLSLPIALSLCLFLYLSLSFHLYVSFFSSLCKLFCMHISLCILPISIYLFSLFLPSSYVCKLKYVFSIFSISLSFYAFFSFSHILVYLCFSLFLYIFVLFTKSGKEHCHLKKHKWSKNL